MSEDFLRVWQQSYASMDLPKTEKWLEKFIEFIKGEVQNEERINVAMSGFGTSTKTQKPFKKVTSPKEYIKQSLPTATGILSLDTSDKKSTISCIFCNDHRHNSADCYKARNMTYTERLDIVKSKKCCLICIKSNHLASTCKLKQRCAICDKRHVILLCPHFKRSASTGVSVTDSEVKSSPAQPETSLANLTSDNVLLPTLIVKVRGNGVEKHVKAVLDTGSQRSYLLKRTAKEMNYLPIAEESIVHSLFGGKRSDMCEHSKYKVHLSSVDDQYLCNFDVLDQDNICDSIPHFKDDELLKCLDQNNITLPSKLFLESPVELLIGADVLGKLFTGNIKPLCHGLTAMETRFVRYF